MIHHCQEIGVQLSELEEQVIRMRHCLNVVKTNTVLSERVYGTINGLWLWATVLKFSIA